MAEAVRRLVQMFAPDRIYLFGSRARGDARPDSDWDLMVILPESAEPKIRRAQRAHLALAGVRLPVDILVWTRKEFDWQAQASASLPATILREGRVLYAA
ncbi:MAG TPA: nucleotidyltransferase domain-containing protein [Dehalococcoidia bacterium]